MKLFFRIVLLFFLSLLRMHTASAHDARPLSITIVEQAENIYRVVVRAPPTLELQNAPSVIWPALCEVNQNTPLNQALGSTSIIECSTNLEGQTISLQYPSFNPSLTSLFRLETLSGTSMSAVLPPNELSWQVPVNPGWQTVAIEYARLGYQHIWEGIDHLLFVAGLLLLAQRPKKILLAITGFTLAHSITLSLAALELVRVPVELIEAMIALSILFLAAEIARNNPTSFSKRFPVALSFVFGLLHGFGFAAALGEISLPTNEKVTGLLFFNVGVELGQLAFIAAIMSLLFVIFKAISLTKNTKSGFFSPRITLIGAYALGFPSAYWFIERFISSLAV